MYHHKNTLPPLLIDKDQSSLDFCLENKVHAACQIRQNHKRCLYIYFGLSGFFPAHPPLATMCFREINPVYFLFCHSYFLFLLLYTAIYCDMKRHPALNLYRRSLRPFNGPHHAGLD